jgi:hypothetical protein
MKASMLQGEWWLHDHSEEKIALHVLVHVV